MKNKITPHKGGRDAWLPGGRMNSEIKKKLQELLKRRGESFADWVERHVLEDAQQRED